MDFVVFGTVPWQEPWFVEHNLADALARRHRVLYIEPPVTPLSPLRQRSAARRRAVLGEVRRRRPRNVGRLHAFRPLALPPLEHPRARTASAPFVRRQVRQAARSIGIERPVAVAAQRSTAELRGAVDERLLVYLVIDWVGAGGELLGVDGKRLRADAEEMCRTADLICASSRELRSRLAEGGLESELLPHGFHADLTDRYDSAASPPEYSGLPRPLIGYSGTIDARLDFEALAALADRYADGSLVLVGPFSPRLPRELIEPLATRRNVHILGPRPRVDVPAYQRHVDCSVMPYRDDEWTRHAMPLKLWDYLYAGPPIVGSGCESLREFPPPLVRFSSGPAGLVEAVGEALAAGDDGREQRRALALANSWDVRARRLEELVEMRLEGGDADRPGPGRSALDRADPKGPRPGPRVDAVHQRRDVRSPLADERVQRQDDLPGRVLR